jgi:uncharacterized protein YndB with AHSA1/START domain
MIPSFDPSRDLSIARVIRAPRAAVWDAWADPRSLEQWWTPAPTECRVVTLELAAGGGFVTQMREPGAPFVPHMDACFLEVVERERIVFTNLLTGGWRPARQGFVSAVLSFADHDEGTLYAAHVLHAGAEARQTHLDLGFADGWGSVAAQLAAFAEARVN